MSNVVHFPSPVSTQCTASTMPAMDTAEHRRRARDNYYTALRHQQIDCMTAHDLADGFEMTLERIAREMGVQQ